MRVISRVLWVDVALRGLFTRPVLRAQEFRAGLDVRLAQFDPEARAQRVAPAREPGG